MADTSTYPATLDGDLRALVPAGTTPSGFEDFAQLVADAVAKIETELGTNPSGAAASVAAAIASALTAAGTSIADAAGDFTATDVEGALAELQADHEADATALADHLADTADAHDASAVSYAGGTGMSATDVEAALDELATEKLDTATAASTYAPLASPALTGTPTAPTPTAGDSSTKVATTAFVGAADAALLPPFPAGSGRYYRLPNTAVTTGAVSAGTFRALPVFIPGTVTLDRIGAEVTAAGDVGSKFRIGIYDDNAGAPGDLVLDAGTINGDSVAIQEITIDQQLTRGWYWFGGATQLVATTAPTMRLTNLSPSLLVPGIYQASPPAAGSLITLNMTGVTGALPATFTVAASAGGTNTASIFARFA